MAESKEYSTIIKCSRKLEIALKSDRAIAQFLHEQGLLTTDDYDIITSPTARLSPAEKSNVLVAAIRDRVELHPRNYHIVVNYMHQNNTKYRDIIEILDREYQGPGVSPELSSPAAVFSLQPLPAKTQPEPIPITATLPITSWKSLEGMTFMMAKPIPHPVPSASTLPRSLSEGTISQMAISTPPASYLPRSLSEGITSMLVAPPPSTGSFSAFPIQLSADCANDKSGKSATAEERFPYLKSEHLSKEERDMLMGRLIADSEDIRSKFSSLLFRTAESLSNEKVSIRFLKILLKPYKISELDESDDEVSKILLKAFDNTYCSLFSFKIVKDIINHLGTIDDKERLTEYEVSFKDYCKRRLCEVPTEVLNPGGTGEEKRTVLYVKTDKIFDVPLEEICIIQSEISKILEKPIHLKGMKEGCVKLIFYLLHELDEVFPLNEKQMNLLKGIGVLRVYDRHKEYFSLSKAFKISSHPHNFEVRGAIKAGPVGGKAKLRAEYENPSLQNEDTDDLHKQVGVGATVGTVARAGVGGGIGAVIGAVVGSIVPGPGTVIGAAIGGTVGAAIRAESENPSPQSEDTDDLHKQVGVGATVGTVAGAGVGGGAGAVIGAVLGFIVPGPGTLIGAAIGAAAGAAIGGGVGTTAGATGGAIHHAAKDKK